MRPTTRFRAIVHLGALLAGLLLATADGAKTESWQCRARPIEQCFKHHGRLSSQNGTPLILWLIGTKRVVSVDNDFADLPPVIQKYLEMTSVITATSMGTSTSRAGHTRTHETCVRGWG